MNREKAGESIENNSVDLANGGHVSDHEDLPKSKTKGAFSGFAALNMEDAGAAEEEEEDFGGLMVRYYKNDVQAHSNEIYGTLSPPSRLRQQKERKTRKRPRRVA